MFDTLLTSHLHSHSQMRSALVAVSLHLALVWGAISNTTMSRATFRSAPRDTIQLDLSRRPMVQHRRSTPAAPPNEIPAIPGPPVAPDFLPHIPAPELPRFARPAFDVTALSRGSPGGGFDLADTASGPRAAAFSVSEVDVTPELRGQLQPHYPESLRAAGVSGRVVLEYVIGSEGMVDTASVRVVLSTHPRFSAAAREALPSAHFSPARRAGQPVAVRVRQTIRFATKSLP